MFVVHKTEKQRMRIVQGQQPLNFSGHDPSMVSTSKISRVRKTEEPEFSVICVATSILALAYARSCTVFSSATGNQQQQGYGCISGICIWDTHLGYGGPPEVFIGHRGAHLGRPQRMPVWDIKCPSRPSRVPAHSGCLYSWETFALKIISGRERTSLMFIKT